MENQQKKENSFLKESDNTAGNGAGNLPDGASEHGKADVGISNPVIESHQEKKESGYKIAIEDTMIGYDGKDDPIDVEQGNGDVKNQNNTHGVDDND
jgi:hypothetical protein